LRHNAIVLTHSNPPIDIECCLWITDLYLLVVLIE
jgi:hypothetical protein